MNIKLPIMAAMAAASLSMPDEADGGTAHRSLVRDYSCKARKRREKARKSRKNQRKARRRNRA